MTRVKVAEVSEILNATLAMRILGMYLGTVLLIIYICYFVATYYRFKRNIHATRKF